jgi:hypothetical protein
MNRVATLKHRPQESKTEDESNYRKYDGEDTNWMMSEVPQSIAREIGADCHIRPVDHRESNTTEVPEGRTVGDMVDRAQGHDRYPDRTKRDQVKGQSRLVNPTIETRIIWL